MKDINKIFPDFETERLILKNINPNDIKFIYEHFSNDIICKYLYDEEPVKTQEEAQGIIDFYKDPVKTGRNRWIIFYKENHLPIGTCGFHCWNPASFKAEIGYDLAYDYWGKGIMAEALYSVIESGFKNMGLNRIQAFISTENENSFRLLERLKFSREGLLRDECYFRGKFYDHYLYALLKRDWK
ncbi:GNAT family N-acetyltransferase [Vallitalea okinawensis]|uniref:GNAT family N-acetyltransferase n=1 Tax=Vallitalea okinawensis TaxID=2078660 RepID=UPI001A9A5829|nr:GNAT family protein [Vallitalea okinawensis]